MFFCVLHGKTCGPKGFINSTRYEIYYSIIHCSTITYCSAITAAVLWTPLELEIENMPNTNAEYSIGHTKPPVAGTRSP